MERGAQDRSVIAVLKQGWDLWGIHDPVLGLKSGVNGERKQNINLSPPWPHRFWGWGHQHVLEMLPALTSKRFWNRNTQPGVWQLLHRCFYWYLLKGHFAPAFAAVDVSDWGPEPAGLNVQSSIELCSNHLNPCYLYQTCSDLQVWNFLLYTVL